MGKPKRVSIVGCGYVGLCLGACLADTKNFKDNYEALYLYDINRKRIEDLNKGIMPFYEPGLEELVKKNSNQLKFTTDLINTANNSSIIFIAIGTPTDEEGNVDLKGYFNAIVDIARVIYDPKIIVNKSTVPVGTADEAKKLICQNYTGKFDLISNPEFLRESTAVYDTINPDRVVIGHENFEAAKKIADLYKDFNFDPKNLLYTDIHSAELIKYASNSFLSMKVSFINEIARICDSVGANVEQVALGMGLDPRIGNRFLNAGIGYGGSCLPKDNRALIKTAKDVGYEFRILKATEEVNKNQRLLVIEKLEKGLGNLEGKVIGLLGLSFKPNTDDMRNAPSLDIIKYLTERKAIVKAYDPIVKSCNGIAIAKDPYELAKDSDALVLVTEWQEFKNLEFFKIKELMKGDVVVDGRNFLDAKLMEFRKFQYYSIGR